MTRTIPSAIVLLLALASVPTAEAGPIIYFDNYRTLDVNGIHFENSSAGFWSAFQRDNFSQGSHMSTIGAQMVDPQGHPYELIRANASLSSPASREAELASSFFTSFQLDSQYSANLSTSLSARDLGYAEGYFFNESTQTMLAQAMTEDGFARLQYTGILEPGLYSYYLFAQIDSPGTNNDHRGTFGGDFTLTQFTPVPEPGTMTLLGLGLAAAWRRRRSLNQQV